MAPAAPQPAAFGAMLVLLLAIMAAPACVRGFVVPTGGASAAPAVSRQSPARPSQVGSHRNSFRDRSVGPADGATDSATAPEASSSLTAKAQQKQKQKHQQQKHQQPTERKWHEPDVEAYASGYSTVFEEIPFRLCRPSYGKIPSDLRGSYYRAGPAMYSAGSIVPPKTSIVQPKQPPVPDGTDPQRMVLHPMEGDGAVLGITFTKPTQQSEEEGDGEEGTAKDDGGGSGTASSEEDDDDVACVVRFRYVRTPGFTNERKKGQRMYTGMDATRQLNDANNDAFQGLANDHPLPLFRHHYQPGLNKLRKNTANTRAVFWGKRLFCLWEGGQPYKMDGRALGTEGRSQLGGAVRKDTDPMGGVLRVDAATQSAIMYGISHGAQSSELTLYEFNSDFRLVQNGRQTIQVPGFFLVNDMGVTPKFAVFVAPNVQCSAVQFLVNKDPGKVLKVEKGGTVVLVPRPGGGGGSDGAAAAAAIRTIPIAPDSLSEANVQIVNAYETDNNLVVLDVIRSDGAQKRPSQGSQWPWATTIEDYRNIASRKSLWRYSVDVRRNEVSKRLLLDRHLDFATINPSVSSLPHQYMYMNVGGTVEGEGGNKARQSSPPQGVLRYDVATGVAQEWMPDAPHEFCGEPLFVPRDNCPKSGDGAPEDDGYLLSVLYNGKTRESDLVIFDAAGISSGPVTRIPLGAAIPHGYYGCFASEHANWSPDEILRRAKLHDKMESRGNYWNEVKSDFSGLGLRLDDMEEYFGDFFT
jgi:all-trans-8'-apo-beta-carotenal 15,15'-oxygenase